MLGYFIIVLTLFGLYSGIKLIAAVITINKRDTEVQKFLEEDKPKDISEPVISFVECVRNNRKRFKCLQNRSDRWCYGDVQSQYEEYSFTDKLTNESWNVSIIYKYKYGKKHEYHPDYNQEVFYNGNGFPDFLTEDEIEYIVTSLEVIYKGYRDILQNRRKIINYRKLRDRDIIKQKERDRLKTIYCNGEFK